MRLPLTAWAGLPDGPRRWQADCLPLILAGARRRERGIVVATMGSGKSILASEVVRTALPASVASGRAIVVTAPTVDLVEQLAGTLEWRLGPGVVGRFYGRRKEPGAAVIVCCNRSFRKLHETLRASGRRVSLLIIDEAHRSEAAEVRDVVPEMAPAVLMGQTATPFRSIPRECLSLFTHIWYRYTLADAVADGVLVPYRVIPWDGGVGVGVDDASVRMILEHGVPAGPGVVSATTIDDADAFAERLVAEGVPAASVHSRLGAREKAARIAALESGEISALVHVSMLQEGVDFPWLRWICLRRRTQASVRFLQEAGRVGRVHPGKTEGLVLDPHCAFGKFGWTNMEAIGNALQQAADSEAEDGDASSTIYDPKPHEAVALPALVDIVAAMRDRLEALGLRDARMSGGWRIAPVSEGQVELLRKRSRWTRHIPQPWRKALQVVSRVPFALTKGEAGDVIDVLFAGFLWAKDHVPPSGDLVRVQMPEEVFEGLPWGDAEDAEHVRRWGDRARRKELARS